MSEPPEYTGGYDSACFGNKPCDVCGLLRGKEGHDPCLGTLPGVEFACCGHGHKEGYIAFTNGRTIRGWFTSVAQYGEPRYERWLTENGEIDVCVERSCAMVAIMPRRKSYHRTVAVQEMERIRWSQPEYPRMTDWSDADN